MNSDQLRRLQSKLSVAFLAAVALALTSCGGGGATSSPTSSGSLAINPSAATIFAGVPYTSTIAGGRGPYLVTSSEQLIIPLNFTIDGNDFSFVANNPGVIDSGLKPEDLPVRTVNITVRDSVGTTVSAAYKVAQNYFTGYGESYASTCVAGTGTTAPQACSGTDTIVTFAPVSGGNRYGGRVYQFDRVRGDFSFVVEDPTVTPQLVDQIRKSTDQTGVVSVRIRVNVNAPTQIASYRITDVATGTTTDALFTIVQQPVADAISLLPSTITFTGANTLRCGAGTADVIIYGGAPPYSLTYSPGLGVSPTSVSSTGGRFSVTAGLTSPPCPTGTSVIVTDSRGAVTVLPVSILVGVTAIPPLTVSPASIPSLGCGQSASVAVTGGTGSALTTSSTHPRISALAGGNQVTVTRNAGDGATIYPTTGQVSVTDGSSATVITVTLTPANCP